MYIGDQLGDVVAANNAGWVSVAFTKGLHTRDKLAEGQPDHWIKKPSNILGLPILKKETTDDK
ncbi:MAG: HAD hydrolase-like protein [bacterium]|nr:HAD hydrolase-like protein [bacterium]